MKNFDESDKTNQNLDWPLIPHYPLNRILIMRDPGSGKTNALLNSIYHQLDIGKIYLYAKDPYESK